MPRRKGFRKRRRRKLADVILLEAKSPWDIPYSVYLKTSHWESLRSRVLKADGRKCVRCRRKATQVHHLTYHRLGRESLKDLASLCRDCHVAVHNGEISLDEFVRRDKKSPRKRRKPLRVRYEKLVRRYRKSEFDPRIVLVRRALLEGHCKEIEQILKREESRLSGGGQEDT